MTEKKAKKEYEFQKISVKSITLWEIVAFLGWAGLLILVLWFFTPFTWLWYLLVWLLGVLLILAELLYLPMLYHSISYCVNDRVIIYRRGVFFNKQQVMYRDRIIYVMVHNTPITPILGISSLIIVAAGAKINIPFLNRRVAKQLAEELLPAPKEIY